MGLAGLLALFGAHFQIDVHTGVKLPLKVGGAVCTVWTAQLIGEGVFLGPVLLTSPRWPNWGPLSTCTVKYIGYIDCV